MFIKPARQAYHFKALDQRNRYSQTNDRTGCAADEDAHGPHYYRSMPEAFVKTFKCDYVRVSRMPGATTPCCDRALVDHRTEGSDISHPRIYQSQSTSRVPG
jgi:hypothetical protein